MTAFETWGALGIIGFGVGVIVVGVWLDLRTTRRS